MDKKTLYALMEEAPKPLAQLSPEEQEVVRAFSELCGVPFSDEVPPDAEPFPPDWDIPAAAPLVSS